jgi:hypothetical protein
MAAVFALLVLGLWRWRRQPSVSSPTAAPPAAAATEDQAQGRFQPVLPKSPAGARPPGRSVTDSDAPTNAKNRPEGRAPTTGGPKPALFDLDLNLDGKAPPLDLGGLSLDLAPPGPSALPKDRA